jgi:hypothetical protein
LQQQQQVLFDEIFKLPAGERMLAMYNVSIVSHSSMLLARARLFLTDRHVCVDANSIFQKLTAAIAWHDVTVLKSSRYMLSARAIDLDTLQGFKLCILLQQPVADLMIALWQTELVRATPLPLAASEFSLPSSSSLCSWRPSFSLAADASEARMLRIRSFHSTFGDDVLGETLLASFECSLLRSDMAHRGSLNITRSCFAFAACTGGTRAVLARADVTKAAAPASGTVVLGLIDGSSFQFVALEAVMN